LLAEVVEEGSADFADASHEMLSSRIRSLPAPATAAQNETGPETARPPL
jgi:hypothetical protein